MDEEELDAMKLLPFGTRDAMRWETQVSDDTRLRMRLGLALWGRTTGDLQRQLLAPHPEIPAGFDLTDFHNLLQWTAQITSVVSQAQRIRTWSPAALSGADAAGGMGSPFVFVGTQRFTLWEARCEIVRRAVDYLEQR